MPSLTRMKPEPMTVVVRGETYRLPTLTIASLRRVQAYLDTLPSPIDRVAKYAAKLPEELRNAEYAKATAAMANWPPQLGSDESMVYLISIPGVDALLQTMLRQGQPGLDDAAIRSIAGDLDLFDVQGVVDHALGIEGKADAPNSPAAPAEA